MSTGRPGDAVLYRTMRLIRAFEERVVDLVNSNEIAGVTHECIGQEAVAVGACAALSSGDVITSTHRGHGHLLAKGADPRRMMAELLGRSTGLNHGRGGSMHITDVSLGIYGANGIVAAGVPIATGAAWSFRLRRTDQVALTFFGDGGLSQGVLYESLNLASLHALPIVFLCENNGYAVTLAAKDGVAGSILERVKSFAMPATHVDGMDVFAVHEVVSEAVAHARSGAGPAFVECETYRYSGHNTGERQLGLSYRSSDEIERWRALDPLKRLGSSLEDEVCRQIDREVAAVIDDAVEYARKSPAPELAESTEYMYASPIPVRAGTLLP